MPTLSAAAIREATEADRDKYTAIMGSGKSLGIPGNHSFVMEEAGKIVGGVVWHAPTAGAVAMLGTVALAKGRDQKDMYRLVLATAEDALARGFKRAEFTLKRPALVTTIHHDFEATIEEAGWNPKTKKAVEWSCEVDVVDAIAQLKAVLGG